LEKAIPRDPTGPAARRTSPPCLTSIRSFRPPVRGLCGTRNRLLGGRLRRRRTFCQTASRVSRDGGLTPAALCPLPRPRPMRRFMHDPASQMAGVLQPAPRPDHGTARVHGGRGRPRAARGRPVASPYVTPYLRGGRPNATALPGQPPRAPPAASGQGATRGAGGRRWSPDAKKPASRLQIRLDPAWRWQTESVPPGSRKVYQARGSLQTHGAPPRKGALCPQSLCLSGHTPLL